MFGETIEISATLQEGYEFISWAASSSASVTFENVANITTSVVQTNVSANITLTASATLKKHTVTVQINGSDQGV